MNYLRLDRALSLGVAHPFTKLFGSHSRAGIPILMYHSVGSGLSQRHPYFETDTTPERFAEQVRFLHENGYVTVDLDRGLPVFTNISKSEKHVVITFDDGFRGVYDHAFPLLSQYGMTATVFLVSDWTKNDRFSNARKEYLTWQEVREMQSKGIRIGSHTVTHSVLRAMKPESVEHEIRQSKEAIEDGLGSSVCSFAYPYAFPEHDNTFRQGLRIALQRSGYGNGVSTILGTATTSHDPFFLPRLPVNEYDDASFFKAKLEGAYDWLHGLQYLSKMIKNGHA